MSPDPIRVFVGTSSDQQLAYQVLEYSLRKHTRSPLEVRAIDGKHLPIPRDPRNRMRTGFSFARFEIPRLCGYKGRAIYLDADMLALRDVDELWSLSLKQHHVLYSRQSPDGAGARFSVLLLDCSRLDWSGERVVQALDAGRCSYEQLMLELCMVQPERKRDGIPEEWNSLDRYVPGETALIHYTSVPTQPWRYASHPCGSVWYRYLLEAVAAGGIPRAAVEEEARRGHVARWLLEWAETSLANPDEAALWGLS